MRSLVSVPPGDAAACKDFDVRVLGPLEVRHRQRVVQLPAGRLRVLLSCLVMSPNEVVSSDTLIDRIWAETPVERARGALHTCVRRLRHLLGPDLVQTRPGGYALRVSAESVDLLRFRDLVRRSESAGDDSGERLVLLREALALRRGDPFSDVASPWLDRGVVPRLNEEWLSALMCRIDLEMAAGRHYELIHELRELTTAHPLHEASWQRLILALHRCGRRAEALEAYQQVLAILRDELALDPSDELRELHRSVLDGGATPSPAGGAGELEPVVGTIVHSAVEPPAQSPPIRPQQLPPDIPCFTGRTRELARLDGLLPAERGQSAQTTAIAVVDGAAGAGKTTLAIHWAHHVRDRFPDGQLYADLRGYGSGAPVEPTAVLEMFLQALGVPAQQIPSELDGRSALLRSTLAGRRVLVLLDNAHDSAQVRPLLPGSHCLVLVTSRGQLRGLAVRHGAYRVGLNRLSVEESVTLLAGVVGEDRIAAEPDTAVRLAGLCAHMPLALALAAERIHHLSGPDNRTGSAAGHTAPLHDLVAELAVERDRLDVLSVGDDETSAVRGVFSWSYDALDTAAAGAFRVLGLHPGPDISIEAAAVLIGVGTEQTRRLVEGLTGRGLLERAGRDRYRYRFHDLMRLYAAERAEAEESERTRLAALHRVLCWYLHTADAAERMLNPGHQHRPPDPFEEGCEPLAFSSHEEALRWSETERANLMAAVRLAFEVGEYTIAWRLPTVLWGFFNLRKHWGDWIESHRVGLAAARAQGDRCGEASVLTGFGFARWNQRRFTEALEWLESALVLRRELGDRWGEGIALTGLGRVRGNLGEPRRALEHHAEALGIFEEIGNHWGQGFALAGLGRVYQDLNESECAREHQSRAVGVFRRIGNRWGEGIALRDLCLTYAALGRHEETIAWCRRALARCHEPGARYAKTRILNVLSHALCETGRSVEARRVWGRTTAFFEELGDSNAARAGDLLGAPTADAGW
ncbi:DNA-binding transcriptional activator of the SARP family [Streptomyces pini]|uniref:DNA-binding transcriptional activator of the SARP family n=1 Tax=Streptomyces pini TaxID=1520580 RepID=A0A1I3XYQ6_9ACTN|nr:DNA-binding transcriptional activator of the SARP family [Streptomyces pini]